MLTILTILSMSISVVFSGCGGSTWQVDYSSDKCTLSGGTYTMKCAEKGNEGTCGMRLSSKQAVGKGSYSAKIKAAPGAGMNTALYLYSYGRNNDKSYAWNEIDIEILGNKIESSSLTYIWTNVWTGYYTQHGQLVAVPWDASAGYHTYKIQITSSQIKWVFDGKTYRTFTYTGYSDLVSTINNKNFQVLMALWGAANNNWPDMGSMWNNPNSYPLYGYFKSVSIGSSFTEEDEAGTTDPVVTVAIVIVSVLFICVLIAGIIYYRRRRKKANGDGASFKAEEETEDSKQAAINDTPSGEHNNTETAGYNMEPINTEQEVEIEVEQQA